MLTEHRADRIAQADDKILIAFKVDVFIDEQLKRLAGLSSRERKRAGGIFKVSFLRRSGIAGSRLAGHLFRYGSAGIAIAGMLYLIAALR